MGKIVNAAQIAANFQVTTQTVLAWQRRGWIPCLKAGRRPVLFDQDEVEAALRERAIPESAANLVNQLIRAHQCRDSETEAHLRRELWERHGVNLFFGSELHGPEPREDGK